jgi:uncharacterized membrane protein YkoI
MRLVRSVVRCVIPFAVLGLLAWPARATAQDKKDDEALKHLQKTSLRQAVLAAEKDSQGTAIAAHVRVKGSKAEVIVFLAVEGKTMQVAVDPKTGTAGEPTEVSAKEEKSEQLGSVKDVAKQLTESKQSLAKVIEAAEKHSAGKAVSIKPRVLNEQVNFTVRVKADGKWQTVVIDGKTGKAKGSQAKPKPEQKANQPQTGGKGGAPAGGKGGVPPAGKGGRGH